jgi:hypothetical protein
MVAVGKLVQAIFNGAPANEDAASYTAQITGLISIYICLVALFLLWLFARRAAQGAVSPERRLFIQWMAFALAASIGAIIVFIALWLAATP